MKKYQLLILLVVLATILVAGQSVLRAQSNARSVAVNNYAEGGIVLQDVGDQSLGATNTAFPHGLEVGDAAILLDSNGSLTITGTTTQQELTLGSRFSKALTFTAGSTTTPGGLFSLQNTRGPLMCRDFIVDVAQASSTLHGLPVNMRFGTSTQSAGWDTGTTNAGGGLLPTTTLATSTSNTFTNTNSSGIGRTWNWDRGMYILGADSIGSTLWSDAGNSAASSTSYSTVSGKVYVDCITR